VGSRSRQLGAVVIEGGASTGRRELYVCELVEIFVTLDHALVDSGLDAELWITPLGFASMIRSAGPPISEGSDPMSQLSDAVAKIARNYCLPDDWPRYLSQLFPSSAFVPSGNEGEMGHGWWLAGRALDVSVATSKHVLLLQLLMTNEGRELPCSAGLLALDAGFETVEGVRASYQEVFPDDPPSDRQWEELTALMDQ
jgi:hypothetical protein